LQTLAEKAEFGNDHAQSQPRVNQERLKQCSIGNLNHFNQTWFRLKRLIPIEHNLIRMILPLSHFHASIICPQVSEDA